MKMLKNLLFGAILIALVLSAGCSKTNDTPKNSINYTSPTIAKDTLVILPSQIEAKETAGNYNLYELSTAATIINVFSTGLSGAFIYDPSQETGWQTTKNSDGSYSYGWTYLQYTVKLTYYSSSSESWWKYEEDSASYNHVLYYIDDKGSSGETDWYGGNSFKQPSYVALKDTWTKSGTTFNSTFNFYASDGVTITNQYVSTSNADKSGTMKIYGQNNSTGPLVLQWDFTWDKNGSGNYTEYNSDGTTVSGTF
jgi:hypothetical protein